MLIDDIAHILREKRLAAGLSQGQLAERSGMSQQQISHLERGRSDTSLSTLNTLAKAMDLTPLLLLAPGSGELSAEDRELVDTLVRVLPELPRHRRLILEELLDSWTDASK